MNPRVNKRLFPALLLALAFANCGKEPKSFETIPQQKALPPVASPRIENPGTDVSWVKVEEVTFDWNQRGRVSLIAELPKSYEDPGAFTRITIRVPGEKEFQLQNEDGWVRYNGKDSWLQSIPKMRRLLASSNSMLHSDCFMVVNVERRRQALLLISWGYASDPARLHILELPPQGPPVVVFNDLFDVETIRDLDADGLLEIAGSPTLSEGLGDNLQTYDPAHVLHFGKTSGEKLAMSIPLSKIYNEKYRCGWAGLKSSEKLLVFKPRNGKPQILPEEKARRLAAAESSKQ